MFRCSKLFSNSRLPWHAGCCFRWRCPQARGCCQGACSNRWAFWKAGHPCQRCSRQFPCFPRGFEAQGIPNRYFIIVHPCLIPWCSCSKLAHNIISILNLTSLLNRTSLFLKNLCAIKLFVVLRTYYSTVSGKWVLTTFSCCSSWHWYCGYIHNVLQSHEVSQKRRTRERAILWWSHHKHKCHTALHCSLVPNSCLCC